jgi:hypothetical protein
MTADFVAALPLAVLAIHLAAIAFNVFGLIAIPLAHALGNESPACSASATTSTQSESDPG